MKNLRLICDTRSVKKGGVSPVKIAIPHKGRTILLPTGIDVLPFQFADGKVTHAPDRNQLNAILRSRIAIVDSALLQIEQTTPLHHLSPTDLRKRIENIITPKETKKHYLCDVLCSLRDRGGISTKRSYKTLDNHLNEYCKNKGIGFNHLSFEDIDRKWLIDFDSFLTCKLSRNSASLFLSLLRATFNYAINEELTNNYPFRGFRIKHERTKSRALTLEQLQTLLSADVTNTERKYRLAFELSLLLLGMNVIDLWKAEPPRQGRVSYRRSKTKANLSVKVGKRAKEILEEIGHNEHLTTCSLLTLPSFRQSINSHLEAICSRIDDFPTVTSYYARHTWATLAAECGIPHHIIGAALGHSWTDVTGVYIGINEAQVDEASERVEKYIYGE